MHDTERYVNLLSLVRRDTFSCVWKLASAPCVWVVVWNFKNIAFFQHIVGRCHVLIWLVWLVLILSSPIHIIAWISWCTTLSRLVHSSQPPPVWRSPSWQQTKITTPPQRYQKFAQSRTFNTLPTSLKVAYICRWINGTVKKSPAVENLRHVVCRV